MCTSLQQKKKLTSLILLVFWLGFIYFLLQTDNIPKVPVWLGPPHFTSTALMAFVIVVFLGVWQVRDGRYLGWYALIISIVVVILLEITQTINPTRSFQIQDILDGIAGAAVGSIVGTIVINILSQKVIMILTLVMTALVVITTFILTDRIDVCEVISPDITEWENNNR